MWFVALQPGQEQPCDCFDHADDIVHMGNHVVKDGKRHKDVYAIAVGDITKAYFSPTAKFAMGSLAQNSSGAIRCSCNSRFRRRFRRVPVGSGGFRCRWLMRFRSVPVQMADEVPEGSGADG